MSVIDKTRNKEAVVAIITNESGRKKFIRNRKSKYNVIAIVRDQFGNIKQMLKAKNIVTDAGDI